VVCLGSKCVSEGLRLPGCPVGTSYVKSMKTLLYFQIIEYCYNMLMFFVLL
jgi:hypothetical protein